MLASVGNILDNPHIGMIFLDYYQTTVGLHVNGTARVTDAQDIEGSTQHHACNERRRSQQGGRQPKAWIVVGVEEAYIHCSKHVPFSRDATNRSSGAPMTNGSGGGNFFKVTPQPFSCNHGGPPGDGDCHFFCWARAMAKAKALVG